MCSVQPELPTLVQLEPEPTLVYVCGVQPKLPPLVQPEPTLVMCDSSSDEMKVSLSEEDVAEIKEMFKEIDVDGSGSITSEELQKVLKEQGAKLHEAVTHVMVAMADTDGDGQINFEEFVQMTIAG